MSEAFACWPTVSPGVAAFNVDGYNSPHPVETSGQRRLQTTQRQPTADDKHSLPHY